MAVASGMYSIMPVLAMPSAVVLALSIVGLVMTEGVIAAVEIPSLLGNVMSYLRIAAVGVGGVIIAEAINELLMPRLDFSPAGIAVFIIMAVLYLAMHLAACMLVMFEALVHGARLNVVEFFGKFYKGGGVRFAPFSVRRNYTQEA
jgi:V/A-type H+-transporting ATPase subunit I